MSTTHTNDARMFPDRGVNMLHSTRDAKNIVNSLHSYVNLSVLMKLKTNAEGKIHRCIDQVCVFSREEETDKNSMVLVVENGKLYKDRVPEKFRQRIEDVLGHDIFMYIPRETGENKDSVKVEDSYEEA